MNIIRTAIASIITVFVSTIAIAETIKVATVNNGDMIRMQGLTCLLYTSPSPRD